MTYPFCEIHGNHSYVCGCPSEKQPSSTPKESPVADESKERARQFNNTLPHCCGYPNCDGDLVGLEHEPVCPLFDKQELTYIEFAAAFARQELAAALKHAESESAETLRYIRHQITSFYGYEVSVSKVLEDLAIARESVNHAAPAETCPTCYSTRRDKCVGFCPDPWHTDGVTNYADPTTGSGEEQAP